MYYLCFGDWGENSALKKQISELVKVLKPDAVLSLGDNFYDTGVLSVYDSKWKDFTNYFHLPFYAILGNHDHLGNILAQIKYKENGWIMPSRFYSHIVENTHLIALDTFELAPLESLHNSICMGMSSTECHKRLDYLNAEKQYEWLERTLQTSTSKWKIVFGHYPIYSNGPHGDTDQLKIHLLPLLKKYGVHLYLAGHDHSICHKEDVVHCIVSGCGSRQSHSNQLHGYTNLPSTGIAYIKTSNVLEFGFHDLNGNIMMQRILTM